MTEDEQAPPRDDQPIGRPGPDASVAPEISRRVGSILDAVENEAARLRDESREEAARYLEHARRHADNLVAERQRRIAELSDELMAKSEAVVARLDDAAPVRQGFENLVGALAHAAERLAHESGGSEARFEPPPYGAPIQPSPPPQGFAQPAPQPPPAYEPSYAPPPLAPQPPPASYPPPPVAHEYGYYPSQQPQAAPPPPAWQPPAPEAPPPPPPGAPQGGTGRRELDDARTTAIQMAAAGSTRGAVRVHLERLLGVGGATGILDEVFGPGSGEGAQVPWTAGPLRGG